MGAVPARGNMYFLCTCMFVKKVDLTLHPGGQGQSDHLEAFLAISLGPCLLPPELKGGFS